MALERVISGGQTGVDRAALDAARGAGLVIGGWCPPERASESGPVPAEYPLRETTQERSALAPEVPRSLRTEWNVRDSDATLVLHPMLVQVDPGTDWTIRCAKHYGRALLACDPDDPGAAPRIQQWLSTLRVQILNVAGPSEGQQPGIGALAYRLLRDVFMARGQLGSGGHDPWPT